MKYDDLVELKILINQLDSLDCDEVDERHEILDDLLDEVRSLTKD